MSDSPAFSWVWLWSILSNAGSLAPQVAALLMSAFGLFEQGVGKLAEAAKLLGITPAPPAPSAPVALSADESVAKQKCMAFLEQHSGMHAEAFGDRIGNFLKNNPWVLQLLAGLIKGAIPTA